ncbi:hypothetical protein [Mesomycoplasma molare]|uniref:Uncharacterized protein n=1 Tax=Mesomycoplasma molare TaxID=171288 RepID=A0ABY5TUS9_9BACT|nr:hypothetical protein [Mesomycoplasma molare]UWD34413.1 hypothetical protein NX772_01115 [Mesomycoplasma molare]
MKNIKREVNNKIKNTLYGILYLNIAFAILFIIIIFIYYLFFQNLLIKERVMLYELTYFQLKHLIVGIFWISPFLLKLLILFIAIIVLKIRLAFFILELKNVDMENKEINNILFLSFISILVPLLWIFIWIKIRKENILCSI